MFAVRDLRRRSVLVSFSFALTKTFSRNLLRRGAFGEIERHLHVVMLRPADS
jgi:hypothetical protein